MLCSFLAAAFMLAAQPDSLQAVTVVADRGVVVSRTDTVMIQSGSNVSEALLQLPGLSVGDYGGAAGLKSVSLRGFGGAHTAIYLDGVRVNNVQSGQLDLGMLGMGSLGSVVTDYAQNSVSFQTVRPVFNGRPIAGTARLQGGSFGTWKPYGRMDFRLGERWSLSAHANGIVSKGNFPLEDGSERLNNDIKQIQTGLDLFGLLQGGDFHGKMYYNGSDRGTPGSLSFPSNDRQIDRNALTQFVLRKAFSPLYTLNVSAKASYDDLQYQSEWGDSRYEQTDWQLNSAHKFRILDWWTVSLAADVSWDNLKSNMYNESRLGTIAALASAFRTQRFKADLAVEYAGVFDKGGAHWNSISPSADLRFTLLDGLDAVAFGRRAYQTPTFNDLYYPGSGNTELKPEDGWLSDLGLDYARNLGYVTLKARLDGFYNYLTNKITWAPADETGYIWLPYNVGKVQAKGVDAMAAADLVLDDWKIGINGRYSWQKIVDKTTPGSYTYDQQLAYVPVHTVVCSEYVSWKGWRLESLYHLRAGRTDGAGTNLDWHTLDGTLSKTFCLGKAGSLALQVKGSNLFNRRFELNNGYPMPGRSLMAGIEYKF